MDQDVPFRQFSVPFEFFLNSEHGLLAEIDTFCIKVVAEFNNGLDAFPSHGFSPFQQGVGILEQSAVPVLLQNSPAAFDRVVFAVVGRVVQQMDALAGMVGKFC